MSGLENYKDVHYRKVGNCSDYSFSEVDSSSDIGNGLIIKSVMDIVMDIGIIER